MPGQLFGTDGVRGRAGDFLTAELALQLARAAVLHGGHERPQVLIVRDTRESGDMLEAAIAAGVTAAGGDALLGGVLPTPAAPMLVLRHGLQLAAVISASHNPYEDNGIKLFAADGYKLDDDSEHAIEAELERTDVNPAPLITGDDLTAAGLTPGPMFRRVLDAVYDAQLEDRVGSKAEAMEMAMSRPPIVGVPAFF